MKRVVLIIIFTLIPVIAQAHPGRVDSSGGHICKTNCEKWGYIYGEYHKHDTVSSTVKEAKVTSKIKSR